MNDENANEFSFFQVWEDHQNKFKVGVLVVGALLLGTAMWWKRDSLLSRKKNE